MTGGIVICTAEKSDRRIILKSVHIGHFVYSFTIYRSKSAVALHIASVNVLQGAVHRDIMNSQEVIAMVKNSTVSVRIDENVKNQAEDILRQLGIPVSVVINTLYHQIIARNGVPFPLTLPSRPRTLDELTQADLDAKLEHSYEQAVSRQGKPMDDVFDSIERKHT